MLASFVDRLIRSQRWLDPVGAYAQTLIGEIYKPLGRPGQALKSLLHGTWLGHALHPVIVNVPLGAWTAAIVADLVAYTGRLRADVGDCCVLVGVLASYGTLVTGYTDFHETASHERNSIPCRGSCGGVPAAPRTISPSCWRWSGTCW